MHGVLIEKVKPCNMHMQIFHFTIQYAYLWEGKRVFSFVLQPKISKQESWTNQNQIQETLSKLISLFRKQSKGEESLFLEEKQEAHYMHMHSIFRFFKA